ncbi:MAG: hypothetical protein JWQ04_1250 [Pedosphaera sp.]|nr:hypothetical protein [Pedosphaera sp.]
MSLQDQLPSKTQKPAPELTISIWGMLAYFLMVAGGGVLALTGIGTFITGNAPMSHWILMLHVSAAPVFAVGLAFVALTWSDRCRFGCARARQGFVTKALLWLILLCGLVVILSGVVPMTPLFGTGGQHLLYLTHRYSGITLACAVVLHLVKLYRAR